jgi:hypothetical protein
MSCSASRVVKAVFLLLLKKFRAGFKLQVMNTEMLYDIRLTRIEM